MNKARINGQTIEEGDLVVIDSDLPNRLNDKYVLSIIDGLANIKLFHQDKKNGQIVLSSVSTKEYTPIYIHAEDDISYIVSGVVVGVLKKPKE